MSWILLLIFFLGNFVQGAVGFGSTLIIVTLGSYFYSIPHILPVLTPIELVSLVWMVYRERAFVQKQDLFRHILPAMALGILFAFVFIPFGEHKGLGLAFAFFVTGVSVVELYRAVRKPEQEPQPFPAWQGNLLLFAAGIVQGVFATSGPLVVAYASRVLKDPRQFRATLMSLWCITSTVNSLRYVHGGFLNGETLQLSALGFAPVLLGTFVGERLHHRLNPAVFRPMVYVLLLISGSSLLLKFLW